MRMRMRIQMATIMTKKNQILRMNQSMMTMTMMIIKVVIVVMMFNLKKHKKFIMVNGVL